MKESQELSKRAPKRSSAAHDDLQARSLGDSSQSLGISSQADICHIDQRSSSRLFEQQRLLNGQVLVVDQMVHGTADPVHVNEQVLTGLGETQTIR